MNSIKIAYFLTHPIQYQSPLIRYLRAGGLDVHVIYGNDATARAYHDEGFGQTFAWDVPLLEGYPSTVLNAAEPAGSDRGRQKHFQRQIAEVLEAGEFDAAWLHGWAHPFTKAAWAEAKVRNIPLMLRGETFLGCVRGGWIRRTLHRLVFSRKFRQVAAFLAVGTLNRQLYRSYGVPENRIFSVPYAVDNAFFQKRAEEARPQREKLRAELGIEPGRPVILFCGKLIGVKDPAILIRAVGELAVEGPAPVLLLAGDGELRPGLEALASQTAAGLVKFLGFQNQTKLPALYDLCDVFVLPSSFEPWGLVVNEVMNAGKPLIVSDQVGSGPDLVREGENGSVFPAGDLRELRAILQRWIADPAACGAAGQTSLQIISQWDFHQCLEGLCQAMEKTTVSLRPCCLEDAE